MSCKSSERSLYFEKKIKPQPTPQEYLVALATSPYKTHRRMAVALQPILDNLIKEKQEQDRKAQDALATISHL